MGAWAMFDSRRSDCKDRSKSQHHSRLQGSMVRTRDYLQGRQTRMVQREPCSRLHPVQDFITPCQTVKCFELICLKHNASRARTTKSYTAVVWVIPHTHISPPVLIFYHKPPFNKRPINTLHTSFPCYKAQTA